MIRNSLRLALGLALLGLGGLAQTQPVFTPDERVILPAATDQQDLVLRLPANAAAGAVTVGPLLADDNRTPISPQPSVTADAAANGTTTLHFRAIHFWGQARMVVSVGTAQYVYTVQRGIELAGPKPPAVGVSTQRGMAADLWFYNPERNALAPAWRVISDGEAVCGVEENGAPRRDCGSDNRWSQVRFVAGGSSRISFLPPDWWFHPWQFGSSHTRVAAIELRYGSGDAAQLQRIDFVLGVPTHAGDLIPSWVHTAAVELRDLLWATMGVSLGAAFLMLAQVMIPNLRRCLAMENHLDILHARLRAIGSQVGDRLYTRCEQEIRSLRRALGMKEDGHQPPAHELTRWAKARRSLFSWPRVLLSANTAEVQRLAAIVPRIETRIRLTERLDEEQASMPESDLRDLPPTLRLERERQMNAARGILSRQFITDAEEKAVSGMLDDIADITKSLKDFGDRLEGRVAALRRRKADTCSPGDPRLNEDCGCGKLLKDPPASPAPVALTTKELIARDLCAIRLEIVFRTIELADLLAKHPSVKADIDEKLKSDDAGELKSADELLSMLSEDVTDDTIREAVAKGLWDALYEPNTITDQDVVRASFLFREERLNRCAAKAGFTCWWHITVDGDRVEVDEPGWAIQFIPTRGRLVVTPALYDRHGEPVKMGAESDATAGKGKLEQLVGRPRSNDPFIRTARGVLDAVITALVPVVTVAVTQGAGSLELSKLVLLGFSSQAIRAAVVPESTTSTSTSTAPKTQTT